MANDKANEKKVKREVVLAPMTVAELAEKLDRPVSAIIMFLLKQGVAAGRNQLLTVDSVAKVAEFFEIPTVAAPEVARCDMISAAEAGALAEKGGKVSCDRLPIVVVVGHVDHGKTTLLDYIRKTRVAAREKGGITQHIGAYTAQTKQGEVVFIDTPGHEAFSIVRARGLRAADVAILVVAADSGVMPQTVEAIERAREAEVPLVVAINKIDRATPKQIDEVKASLAKLDLVPEEWGGSTVFVPISALKGDGVDDLLEMVVLQAQLNGLKTFLDVPADGFVLESRLEKGLGFVATVICRHGVLHVGDPFVCGTATGRVSSLRNALGVMVKEAMPSVPVQVAGFSELPQAGSAFMVGTLATLGDRLTAETQQPKSAARVRMLSAVDERTVRLVVKADTISSMEVLEGALGKISEKSYAGLAIVHSGVGPINESDVAFAADTGATIIGLHTKPEAKAARLAADLQVPVLLHDIIYRLIESVEVLANKGRPIKKTVKKIGEALVLKVFDIKNLGMVAGARVTNGLFQKNGTVKVYRANRLVGSGPIKSLQRDRNMVKEVRKGFECAFMVDDFSDWQVDDRVDCFVEVEKE